MPFQIIRNDITRVEADAIVNTANPKPVIGAGVDSAIYEAAGKQQLLNERKKIGSIAPGEAVATPAFNLNAKYIIHTVGPAWQGGNAGEKEVVANCYSNSLARADELGLESIAFPLISTGTLGFPKALALKTAVSSISAFLLEHDMTVYLVVYNKEAFELSEKLMADVRSYIEESEVVVRDEGGYDTNRRMRLHRFESALPDMAAEPIDGDTFEETMLSEDIKYKGLPPELRGIDYDEQAPELVDGPELGSSDEDLDDFIEKTGDTFQERLFRLIDQKGFDDIEVYKKANLDRKLFSKIKSNPHYVPSKRTAFALAIALKLNMDETVDFIRQAGLAFMPSSTFDKIICYCIERKIYDIYTINCILFKYNQPILGAA